MSAFESSCTAIVRVPGVVRVMTVDTSLVTTYGVVIVGVSSWEPNVLEPADV